MKDLFDRPLAVGQTVAACMQLGRNRYDLVPAEVAGFTAKMVLISRRQWWAGEQIVCHHRIYPYKLVIKETP